MNKIQARRLLNQLLKLSVRLKKLEKMEQRDLVVLNSLERIIDHISRYWRLG